MWKQGGGGVVRYGDQLVGLQLEHRTGSEK